MAGGRLEAGYDNGGIEASFVVYADFLISWDPFHYDISAGVPVSRRLPASRICFFACVTIDVHVSIGASRAPPRAAAARRGQGRPRDLQRHGRRSAPSPAPPPSFIGWDAVHGASYVVAGAQDGSAVSAHAGTGLLAPESGAAPAHPGAHPPSRGASSATSPCARRRGMPATAYTVTGKPGLPPLNEVPGDARRRADERGRRHGHARRHRDDGRGRRRRRRGAHGHALRRQGAGRAVAPRRPSRRRRDAPERAHRHDDRRRIAAGRRQPMDRRRPADDPDRRPGHGRREHAMCRSGSPPAGRSARRCPRT